MSNASCWYPVAKSHQNHQGSQREQLVSKKAIVIKITKVRKENNSEQEGDRQYEERW